MVHGKIVVIILRHILTTLQRANFIGMSLLLIIIPKQLYDHHQFVNENKRQRHIVELSVLTPYINCTTALNACHLRDIVRKLNVCP